MTETIKPEWFFDPTYGENTYEDVRELEPPALEPVEIWGAAVVSKRFYVRYYDEDADEFPIVDFETRDEAAEFIAKRKGV
jgi:hypothetical protein